MNGLLELERQLISQRKKTGRVLPKVSRQNGKAAAPQAYSFSMPVNFQVPGIVPSERQPSSMTCWATVTTMMMSWRQNMSMPIETALSRIGRQYAEKFRRNEGLAGSEKAAFLASAGLIAEPPMSYSLEGWERLLRTYGPLWVTTDEQPGAGFAIHARILTGIRGNGDASAIVDIVDPSGGRQYQERFSDFIRKFEEEARDRSRPLRIQVVHWPADAQVSLQKNICAVYGATTRPILSSAKVVDKIGAGIGVAKFGWEILNAALNNDGDISWEVQQMNGVNCPNNDQRYNKAPWHDGLRVVEKARKTLWGETVSAKFQIRFQYNGNAVGNVAIANAGALDAAGHSLYVKATIHPDLASHLRGGKQPVARIEVRFEFHFRHSIGDEDIWIETVSLYGTGEEDPPRGEWTQGGP